MADRGRVRAILDRSFAEATTPSTIETDKPGPQPTVARQSMWDTTREFFTSDLPKETAAPTRQLTVRDMESAAPPAPAATVATVPTETAPPAVEPPRESGPLSRALQMLPSHQTRTLNRDVATQRDVMGTASPNDRAAAQGTRTFLTRDLPTVGATFGARVGAGMERAVGGIMQTVAEAPGEAYVGYLPPDEAAAAQAADAQRRDRLLTVGRDLGAEGRMISETVQQDRPLLTRAGKIVGSTAESIGMNIPGMAATMVTGSPALGLSAMGLQTFGDAYDEARSKGLGIEDATTSAAIQGGTEVATELAPFMKLAGFLKPGKLSKKVLQHYLADVPGEHVATAVQNATGQAFDKQYATTEERKQAAIDYLVSGQHGQDQVDTFFTTLLQSAVMGGMAKTARTGAEAFENRGQDTITSGVEIVPPTEPPTNPARAGRREKLAAVMADETPETAARRLAMIQERAVEGREEEAPDQPVDWAAFGIDPDGITDEIVARKEAKDGGIEGTAGVPQQDVVNNDETGDGGRSADGNAPIAEKAPAPTAKTKTDIRSTDAEISTAGGQGAEEAETGGVPVVPEAAGPLDTGAAGEIEASGQDTDTQQDTDYAAGMAGTEGEKPGRTATNKDVAGTGGTAKTTATGDIQQSGNGRRSSTRTAADLADTEVKVEQTGGISVDKSITEGVISNDQVQREGRKQAEGAKNANADEGREEGLLKSDEPASTAAPTSTKKAAKNEAKTTKSGTEPDTVPSMPGMDGPEGGGVPVLQPADAGTDLGAKNRAILEKVRAPKKKTDAVFGELVKAHGKEAVALLNAQGLIRLVGKDAVITKAGEKWLKNNPAAVQPPVRSAAQQANDERLRNERSTVNPEKDDIAHAIAKLGGLDKGEAFREWGNTILDSVAWKKAPFGKPVFRKTGGVSIDRMAELLAERGYLSRDENGKHDLREFEEKLQQHAGGQKIKSDTRDTFDAEVEELVRQREEELADIPDEALDEINYWEFTEDERNIIQALYQEALEEARESVYNEHEGETLSAEEFDQLHSEALAAFWEEQDEKGNEGEVERTAARPAESSDGGRQEAGTEPAEKESTAEQGTEEAKPSLDDFDRMFDEEAARLEKPSGLRPMDILRDEIRKANSDAYRRGLDAGKKYTSGVIDNPYSDRDKRDAWAVGHADGRNEPAATKPPRFEKTAAGDQGVLIQGTRELGKGKNRKNKGTAGLEDMALFTEPRERKAEADQGTLSSLEAAKQDAATAFKEGAAAIKAILKNVTDPNRVGSGPVFDDEVYSQIRPHLVNMWEAAKSSGENFMEAVKDFIRRVISEVGVEVKPYAKRFYEEVVTDAERGSDSVERDSQDAAAADGMGEGDVSPQSAADDTERRERLQDDDEAGFQQDRDSLLPRNETVAPGERGDQSIPGDESGAQYSATERGDDQRSGDTGDQRTLIESVSTRAVGSAAKENDPRAKREAQRNAQNVAVVVGDRANVDSTLPFLTEGQRDDVTYAETRFAKPDGYGVLFTNGTGTGKTASGLGVVKRYERQGKKNILIVAPSEGVINAWVEFGKFLDLDISPLLNTKDAGRGISITTYANFGQNPLLASRNWDLIVTDEAHYLSQNKDGEASLALNALQAITLHPSGVWTRAENLHRDQVAQLRRAQHNAQTAQKNKAPNAAQLLAEADRLWRAWTGTVDKVRADVMAKQGEARPRVVFLSATPFAYEKSVDWAQGYLFDWNEGKQSDSSRGYNVGDNRAQFYMQHFGYRMRYNKLTEPGPEVDRGLMQRQFNSYLKRQGVLSSRVLDVPFDYDRKFIMVDSAVGSKIDEGLKWLQDNRRMSAIHSLVTEKFDHLTRRYLLEAIKAEEVVPIAKEHLALGRKVVIFHDFKKGGGFNPFDVSAYVNSEVEVNVGESGQRDMVKLGTLVREFMTQRKDLVELPLASMRSPLTTLPKAFPNILLYNGDVSKKNRDQAKTLFQEDDSGNDIILVQSAAGKEGISLHDTTGKKQRILINLGLPTQPTTSIQQEGRIYRYGQASDAMFRYLNTGTNWERYAFATTIANRSSTAENLALGESARALKDAFIQAFEESDSYPAGHEGEGTGGKERDRIANAALTEWDRATAYYFGQRKGRQNNIGEDYFATPEPLGLKMVEWADVLPGEAVLEPSGGHGAIARWFPEQAKRRLIEPSMELASRAALVFDGDIVQGRFEDHNIVNKYDAIVMNPPFGSGGRTAVDHLEKAAQHLKENGRIVAIIPRGPAADKKFDKWLYEEKERDIKPLIEHPEHGPIYKGDTVTISTFGDSSADVIVQEVIKSGAALFIRGKGESAGSARNMVAVKQVKPTGPRVEKIANDMLLTASLDLPAVTFERAGTKVMTRVVVLDKGGDVRQVTRDYTGAENIKDFFARIQDVTIPGRIRPQSQPEAIPTPEAPANVDREGVALGQFEHTKTGEQMYVATVEKKLSDEDYKKVNALAKSFGGYYNSFKGGGAIRGFLFKSAEERQQFVEALAPGADKVEEGGVAYEVREPGTGTGKPAKNSRNMDGTGGIQLDLFAFQNPPTEKQQREIKRWAKADKFTIGTIKTGITSVTTPEQAAHIVAPLRKLAQEAFVIVVTGKNGKLLGAIQHTTGSLNQSIVMPRDFLGLVNSFEGAEAFWMAHNHPSGDVSPSREDLNITQRIETVVAGSGVTMAGHIIVGSGAKAGVIKDGDVSTVVAIPGSRSTDLPMYSRRIFKRASSEKMTTPADVSELIQKEKLEGTGLLLIDGKSRATAFLPMSIDEMRKLKTGKTDSGSSLIMKTFADTNSATMFVKVSDITAEKDTEAVKNVAVFADALGAKILDAIDDNGRTKTSSGTMPTVSMGDTFYDITSVVPLALQELGKLAKAGKEALPHLITVGRQAWESGATTYQKFTAAMKQQLGDMWDRFKSMMLQVWERVRRDERGLIGPDINAATGQAFRSIDPEVQRRRDAAHGLDKGPGLLDRMKELLELAKKETQHFPELDMTKDARTADILRVFEASRQAATAKTVAYLTKLTRGFTPQEMTQFEWRVLLDDLMEESDKGRALPFGYTTETLELDHANIVQATDGNAKIKAALDFRRETQERIVKDLVDAGLLPESVLENKSYFRHMVLEYANARKWAGLGSKELRNKKRGWQKGRQGSELDINTNFLEAEFEVYSQQLKELATKEAIDKVSAINNIGPKLKRKAKADNFENLVGGPDVVRRIRSLEGEAAEIRSGEVDGTARQRLAEITQELDSLDPTRPFKRSMAMGFSKLERLARNGALPAGKFKGVAEALASGEPNEKLFNYLSYLAGHNDEAVSLPARQILKAIADLDKLYRQELGSEYLEYRTRIDERLIPEGYVEWQPEKGNIFYRETTLPEQIVNRAIDAAWSIQELVDSGIMKESLVVGGRKKVLILPEGVAKTLDNLRIERDTAVLDTINKKLIGAWKIWTLLSPRRAFKYNLNNMSGDMDAALAADPKILLYAKQALRNAMRRKRGELTALDQDMIDRGVLDSGISVNEIPDISQLPFFRELSESQRAERLWTALRGGNLSVLAPTTIISKYFGKVSQLTNIREGLLREAAYLRALELLREGKPVLWASNKAELDAIPELEDKAAKLSRELIGDYGNISAHGERIRARYIPFWSWCVPENTEILTRRGWKKYDELVVGEDVLTYNMEKRITEWQKAEDKAEYPFDGKLVTLKNKHGFKYQFTEDHRVVVIEKYKNQRKIVLGKDLKTHHHIPLVAPHEFTHKSILNSTEAALLGWIVTDGYTRHRGKNMEAVIYQKKPDMVEKIRKNFAQYISSESVHPETGTICFRLHAAGMRNIRTVFHDKNDLSAIVTKLDRPACEAMYRAMLDAEGSETNGYIAFPQNNGPVIDAFQILCYMLGKAAQIRPKRRKGFKGQSEDHKTLYVKSGDKLQLYKWENTREEYQGMVWCPKTENKTWVMRQDGKVMITGNCEINTPRYYRIFRNAAMNGGKFSTGARIAGVGGKKFIGTTAGIMEKVVLTQMLFALVTAFNHLVWGDDDDDLDQKQLHLIVGKDSEGRFLSVRFQGAFSDALSWFGLEDYPEVISKVNDGSMDAFDLGKKIAMATPNKLINAALPYAKLAAETALGKSFYPDVTRPRQVRDRVEHVARFLSLDAEYRAVAGKPSRGYLDSLKGIVFYTSDPRETAYNQVREQAAKWMEKQGKEMPGGDPTARSNALYYHKQAKRFGDEEAAQKYLEQYQELGGTRQGLKTSIRNAAPLHTTGKHSRQFIDSLSAKGKEKVKLANEFYRAVYLGE